LSRSALRSKSIGVSGCSIIRSREAGSEIAIAQPFALPPIFEQKLEMLRQFFRRLQFFGHFARSVAREDKTIVALSLQKHAFEDVLAKINAEYRVSAPRHGGVLPIAGSVPTLAVFCPPLTCGSHGRTPTKWPLNSRPEPD